MSPIPAAPEEALPGEEEAPDWRVLDHDPRRPTIDLVPIERDRETKTAEPEWVPMKKD